MQILINLLLSAIAVIISAYLLPGVHVANFLAAIIVAVVFLWIPYSFTVI